VGAEHQHVRLVERPRVEELPKALRRTMQIGREEDLRPRARHAQPTGAADRARRAASVKRAARSGSTRFQVIPSTLSDVPTMTPSATLKMPAIRSPLTPVFATTHVASAAA